MKLKILIADIFAEMRSIWAKWTKGINLEPADLFPELINSLKNTGRGKLKFLKTASIGIALNNKPEETGPVGVIPFCAFCREVGGDFITRSWQDALIEDRTLAYFRHSICPGCDGELSRTPLEPVPYPGPVRTKGSSLYQ